MKYVRNKSSVRSSVTGILVCFILENGSFVMLFLMLAVSLMEQRKVVSVHTVL